MRKKICSALLIVFGLLVSTGVFAQNNSSEETGMRSNGKIYVVMAICITILVGLILYLVSIDRKLSNLEKHQ